MRQLAYFAEVARSGSISRAAERLNLAQPALSRRIMELERAVGAELFLRQPNGVVLTALGAKVLEHADLLFAAFERLRQDLTQELALLTQRIELGVPASASFLVTDALLERFRAVHPNVQLHVVEGTSPNLQARIQSGELDLALVTNPQKTVLQRVIPLWREDLFVVEAPGGGFREGGMAALAGRQFILTSRSDGVREGLRQLFEAAGLPFRIDLEMEVLGSVKPIVAAGRAYTILPVSRVAEDLATGTLVATKLPGAWITRALVHRTGKVLTPPMRGFIQAVRQEVELTIPPAGWIGGDEDGPDLARSQG